MAAKPWNFPTYRVGGSYNFANDSDPYYTSGNDVVDFNDNATFTFIGAIVLPPGFAISGHNQNTSMTSSSYPPIWTLGRYGENDANYGVRCYHNNSGSNTGLQVYMYDGVGATYTSMQITFATLVAAGINPEFQTLQMALSVDQATGKRLWYINGIEFINNTVTPWFSSTGCHRSNNARCTHNAYANWVTTTWSAGGQSGEYVTGPRLVHDAFLDLSDPSVRANIFDENGDFIWPGHNGAGWLGGTTPWYYSEVGVPWNGNKGTCTAAYTRVSSTSYTRWGHPCGSKWDWPNAPTEQWILAAALPGIQGVWDMSGLYDESKYFLYNPFLPNGGHVKRYTTTYGAYPSFPQREGAIGAPGYNYSISTYHGYYDPGAVLDNLCQNAANLYMTICLDFTMIPTANFGFQKIIGWRSSSSTSYFGVYATWPNGTDRNPVLQYRGNIGQDWLNCGGIPTNTKVLPLTWCFNSGQVRIFKGMVKHSDLDRSGIAGTTIYNAASQFGWMDYTSSASGAFPVSADFVSIGTGNPSDAEILALHAALMNGAY